MNEYDAAVELIRKLDINRLLLNLDRATDSDNAALAERFEVYDRARRRNQR